MHVLVVLHQDVGLPNERQELRRSLWPRFPRVRRLAVAPPLKRERRFITVPPDALENVCHAQGAARGRGAIRVTIRSYQGAESERMIKRSHCAARLAPPRRRRKN